MRVEFVNLKRQYENLQEEIRESMERVLKDARFIFGEDLESFEKEFAAYCGVNYGVGVASGTDALVLAVRALDISEGDEVITVPNTFTATADAIVRNGAKPVFVDVDEHTFNMDPWCLEGAITEKTKAIIVVHLCGLPASMGAIMRIAKDHSLKVIEDCAQAHGAIYRNQVVGSFGDVSCFSFYPGKNLGAYGDGGMVVTNSELLARKLKMLRFYGQEEKYYHNLIGYNSRLDNLQAAILRVKLKKLTEWNRARRVAAEMYRKLLRGVGDLVLPEDIFDRDHVYHLFMVRTKHRDALQKHLKSEGVDTVIHYPVPLHLQKAYEFLGHKEGDFPITEQCAQEILSLPMFPEIMEAEVKHVANAVKHFFEIVNIDALYHQGVR